MERLRICVVCHPTQGGSGILATELGKAMAARGHQVHFVSHTRPFRLPDDTPNVHFHKVRISDYPLFRYPPYSIALAGKLTELMQEQHFDVLHIHYAIPHAVSAFLSHEILKERAPKILVTMHGTDVTVVGAEQELKAVTGFVLGNCDALTAVSEALKTASVEVFGLERAIDVIPNFVDIARFTPAKRSGPGRRALAPHGEPLIGHMSNFRAVKRVGDVIDVFRRVRATLPARLVLIGDGPMLSEARCRLAEAGLDGDVMETGAIQNVEDILPQLDVFLLPSQTESFGLAALEAMASGVPCVTTNAGGLPEVIRDGVEGYTRTVGDTAAMAEAVQAILTDAALHEQLGAAARTRAETAFALDKIVDRYEAVYRQLSAASGGGAGPTG